MFSMGVVDHVELWDARTRCHFCHMTIREKAWRYHEWLYHGHCFEKLMIIARRSGGVL